MKGDHVILSSPSKFRRGSRILKWGVNLCNNVLEPINIWGIRKKKRERRGLRKRGMKIHPFHLPWIRAWSSLCSNLLRLKGAVVERCNTPEWHIRLNGDRQVVIPVYHPNYWYLAFFDPHIANLVPTKNQVVPIFREQPQSFIDKRLCGLKYHSTRNLMVSKATVNWQPGN